jgi:3-oxocholest-4-en-26-oate---CoA ligase
LRHGRFTIVDSLSATEAGGFATAEANDPGEIETARFRLGPNTRVLNDEGKDVVPGSGEIGMLAVTGRLPKGYLNDPEKSAATWPVIDGVRYAMPGDLATVEPDGTITLLGQGRAGRRTLGQPRDRRRRRPGRLRADRAGARRSRRPAAGGLQAAPPGRLRR